MYFFKEAPADRLSLHSPRHDFAWIWASRPENCPNFIKNPLQPQLLAAALQLQLICFHITRAKFCFALPLFAAGTTPSGLRIIICVFCHIGWKAHTVWLITFFHGRGRLTSEAWSSQFSSPMAQLNMDMTQSEMVRQYVICDYASLFWLVFRICV